MTQVFVPATLEEAVALLRAHPGARCIAGGGNLVAAMNAGEAAAALVSLQGISGLAGVSRLADGSVRIGALTRHAVVAAADVPDGQRVVAQAAAVIANPVVRNMGTIGGSVANSDPAADYPVALVACGATVEMIGSSGTRSVPAAAFFRGNGMTALAAGEIVTGVVVPPAPAWSVGVYRKLRRTHGDYAIASVALVLGLRDGVVSHFACAIGGCGPVPVRLPSVEAALLGAPLDDAAVRTAGAALAAACEPVDDIRATAAYRRMVVPRLFASTVAEACGLLLTPA
jgi:carbon-monoxide dehydrogenase medium subunit